MTATTYTISAIAIMAILAFVMLRPKKTTSGRTMFFKRDYDGERIDIIKKCGSKEVVVKSYEYTKENQELAHACADEVLYYLKQDYTEMLNG